MAEFQPAVTIVLANEGGYVNDPDDPGGETNMGITYGCFEGCAETLLQVQPCSTALKALTTQQAQTIYHALYWTPMMGSEFTSQNLANLVLDTCVNNGVGSGIKLLQQVLRDQGKPVAVDGRMGAITLAALLALPQQTVYQQYKQARIDRYKQLCVRRPANKKFLKGWLARVNRFPDEC